MKRKLTKVEIIVLIIPFIIALPLIVAYLRTLFWTEHVLQIPNIAMGTAQWSVFSPDDSLLVTGSNVVVNANHLTQLDLWEIRSGKHLRTLSRCDNVSYIDFAQGGKTLITVENYQDPPSFTFPPRLAIYHLDEQRSVSYPLDSKITHKFLCKVKALSYK
jgi:WD40 repeat protein